jgi:hypothetical protein
VGVARRVIDWTRLDQPAREDAPTSPEPAEGPNTAVFTFTAQPGDTKLQKLLISAANIAIAKMVNDPSPQSGQEVATKDVDGFRVVIRWGPAIDVGEKQKKSKVIDEQRQYFSEQAKTLKEQLRAKEEEAEKARLSYIQAFLGTKTEAFQRRLEEVAQLSGKDIDALIGALKLRGMEAGKAADAANYIVDLYRNRMSDRAVVVEPPEPTKDATRSGITFRDIAEWQREVIAQGVPEPVAFDAVQRYAANCARTGEATSRPIRAILKIVDDMKVASEVGQKKGGGGGDGK